MLLLIVIKMMMIECLLNSIPPANYHVSFLVSIRMIGAEKMEEKRRRGKITDPGELFFSPGIR
jgi:hypothetical protein